MFRAYFLLEPKEKKKCVCVCVCVCVCKVLTLIYDVEVLVDCLSKGVSFN